MNIQFTHIATILFEHTYFSDGVFTPMEVIVRPETLRTLHNLEIVVKPFAGGCHILTADIERLKTMQKDIPLEFEMRCTDSYYINYSELPSFNPSSELFYFANREADYIEENKKIILHNGFVKDKVILRVVGNEATLNSFDEFQEYHFYLSSTGEDLSHLVQQPDPSVNRFILGNVPDGIIEVKVDEKISERFYHNTSALWRKPVGIIKLSTNHLYSQFTTRSSTVQYAIQFEARQTYWEYYFSKDRISSFEHLAIIKSHEDQDFKYIGTNESSMVYRSVSPRHLSQSGYENFQFVHNFTPETASDRTYATIINQLPIPSPHQLYPNSDHPSDPTVPLFSHIYVHI